MKLNFYLVFIIQFTVFQLISQINTNSTKLNTILFENQLRTFYLHIPESINQNKPFPLLLAFHGLGGNAFSMVNSGMNKIAEQECFAVCYLQGIEKKWNVGGEVFNNNQDDIAFVNFIIENLSSNFNINKNAIFAYGMSNGGFMSYKLACNLSDKIKAIASVTGSTTKQILINCKQKKTVPILQIHGTNDNVVPFLHENKYGKSVKQTLNYWTKKYNCSKSKINKSYNKDCEQREIMYSKAVNCDAQIKLINVKNAGHEWFCFSNEEIWWFFNQFIIN